MTTADTKATATPRPAGMPPAPEGWPDWTDPAALPAGHDDEASAYYLPPELRPHFTWTADDENDLQRNRPKHGVPVSVPAPEDHRRRGGRKWGVIGASPDDPAGLSLIRFQRAEARAKFAHQQAARSREVAARIDANDTCAICGKITRGLAGGMVPGIEATQRRTILTASGQRAIRCCGRCVIVVEALTLAAARAEIIDDDGRTREDAAAAWLETIKEDRR